jgi:hypothetical protein
MNARGRRGTRIASSTLAANKEVRHEATAAFRDGRPGGRAVVRLRRPCAAGTATNPAAATPHATEPAAAADGADHVRTNHAVHQRRQLLRHNTTDRDINATDNDDTPRNNPKFSSLAGS